MPIEKAICLTEEELLNHQTGVSVYLIAHYLVPFFLLDITSMEADVKWFDQLYEKLPLLDNDYEPRMNILAWKTDHAIRVCVIPRKKLRPDCYYATDQTRLLISPASVEMGGLIVLSYPNDYDQLTAERLKSELDEGCYSIGELCGLS